MVSLFRRSRPSTPQAQPQRQPVIDRLEGRLYFAHLGHEVILPAAASNGGNGLAVVEQTYTFADHRRSKLGFIEQDNL